MKNIHFMFYGSSEQHRSSDYSQSIRIGLSLPPVGGAAEIVVTVHDGCAIRDNYRFQNTAEHQWEEKDPKEDNENSSAHNLTFYQILTSSTLACYPSADPRLVRY
jgi:hypothetical protein